MTIKNAIRFVSVMVLAVGSLWAAPTQIDVTVNGMVCSFCAQGITKKFKSRSEVDAVRVVMKDQNVHLTLKDGQDIPDQDIKNLLLQSGYNVEKIERKKS